MNLASPSNSPAKPELEPRKGAGDALGKLRRIGLLEGWSFLLLLGVAMPLKYGAGISLGVAIMGPIHGALWVAFCFFLILVWFQRRWSLGRAALVFLAGVVPFGPFVIDRRLLTEPAPVS